MHKLFIVAGIISILLTIIAGGDGITSDGNIKVAFISCAVFVLCVFVVRIISQLMILMKRNCKRRFRCKQ